MGNKMGNDGQQWAIMGSDGQKRQKLCFCLVSVGDPFLIEDWKKRILFRRSSEITNSQAGSASSTASGYPDGMVWADMRGCQQKNLHQILLDWKYLGSISDNGTTMLVVQWSAVINIHLI